jgi:hypothetical protein
LMLPPRINRAASDADSKCKFVSSMIYASD